MKREKTEIGKTKTAGFQVGVRRTFSRPAEVVWDFLLSRPGLALWLGNLDPEQFQPETELQLSEGLRLRLTTFRPGSHLRLEWQPSDWSNNSTLQLRVIPQGENKTTLSFHQEHLLDAAQRAGMKKHWLGVLDALEASGFGVD